MIPMLLQIVIWKIFLKHCAKLSSGAITIDV